MESRPIIVLDMDGVMVDPHHEQLRDINARFGTSYTYEGITDFGYRYMPKPHRDATYAWWETMSYDGMELSHEALHVLKAMRRFARVICCTTPMVGHIQSKYKLALHYFDKPDIYLAKDKTLIIGDVLVDDALHNIEPWRATGRSGIIFDRPWNQTGTGHRAHNWTEMGDIITDILLRQEHAIY